MGIKNLILKIAVNVIIVLTLLWLAFTIPSSKKNIFTFENTTLSYNELIIEDGNMYGDGELIVEEDVDSPFVFTDNELQEAYAEAIDEVIATSNKVDILGDQTVYLEYIKTKPTIVCVFSDKYRFSTYGLRESTLVIDALNRILGLNIVLMPVSAFTEDKGIESVIELVESGQAHIGVYQEYVFQTQVNFSEQNFAVSKPFCVNKVYSIALESKDKLDFNNDRIAFINISEDYDKERIRNEEVYFANKEEGVEMLRNGEVDFLVGVAGDDLEYYAEQGLYMSIINDDSATGLNYLIAKEGYAKAVIDIINRLFSSESISAISDFGEKKYNHTTMKYLEKAKNTDVDHILTDGYFDVGYIEHVGLLATDENGVLVGYSVDVMKYLSEALDMKFRLHDYTSLPYSELQESLNREDIDGIIGYPETRVLTKSSEMINSAKTAPYLVYRYDIQMKVGTETISSLEQLNYVDIGTVKTDRNAISLYINDRLKYSAASNLKLYDSYEELSDALKDGEIMYAISYPGFTKYMQDKGQYWCVDAYNQNAYLGNNVTDFFYQVNGDLENSEELVNMLNTGISTLDTDVLMLRWFYNDTIFKSVVSVYKENEVLFILIFIVFIIILAYTALTASQHKKTERYLTDILLIDKATKFGNKYSFNQAMEPKDRIYFIKTRIPNFRFVISTLSDDEVDIFYSLIAGRIAAFDEQIEGAQHFHLAEDEFVILLPYDEKLKISKYLDELLDILKAIYIVKDKQLEVKMQIIAVDNALVDYDNSRLITYCSLVLDANGTAETNRRTVLTNSMLQKLRKLEYLDDLLNGSLEDKVIPYYTPIYDKETKSIIGIEAIGRIVTPEMVIPRSEYIEHVIDSGLNGEIQELLLYRIVKDRDDLIKRGIVGEDFIFSFYGGEELILQYIDSFLEKAREDGYEDLSFIRILVSELDLVKPEIVQKVIELKEYNIKIFVQDFNVGHSSLGKIISLKLDGVKITSHYHGEMGTGLENTLFESLIKMVSEINVPICVSDVEDNKDFEYMNSKDIKCLQGPYFLRPVPIKVMEGYLADKEKVVYDDFK